MRTLSVLLALRQYYHYSVRRFGFGPHVLQDLTLGTLATGPLQESHMKGISGWQQLDIGPYQGREVPGSWNAEGLPWGAVDACLAWGAVLWAAELNRECF